MINNLMAIKIFRKLFHWGPLFSLGIIKFVTTATIYSVNIWWPVGQSVGSVINISVFGLFASLAVYNFICAVCIGPGYVPRKWHPVNSHDEIYMQYCSVCKGFKVPRSHHCRKCGKCVLKMDHHCPWINNCVGHKNHRYFTCFLLVAVCGSIHSLVLLIMTAVKFLNADLRYHSSSIFRFSLFSFASCLFCIGISFGVIMSLSALFFFQMKSILQNKTGIEYWIIEKAYERRLYDRTVPPFIYPYDLGWIRNIRQVFSYSQIGDGKYWPVIEGCSQYDLTVEQLEQKILKRSRKRPFKVMYKYSGSCCPITHGICTFLRPPYTLENRMPLTPDELILVTRNNRYWLFGEKCASHVQMKCKGWFPRSCVVPVTDYRDDIFDDKKEM